MLQLKLSLLLLISDAHLLNLLHRLDVHYNSQTTYQKLTITDLLLYDLLLGQLGLLCFLLMDFFLNVFLFCLNGLVLILLALGLELLLSALLVGQICLLLLKGDLLVNNLFLAWLLAIIMPTRMLFLVPAVAAGAWLCHQADYITINH